MKHYVVKVVLRDGTIQFMHPNSDSFISAIHYVCNSVVYSHIVSVTITEVAI